ncbi:MAG: methyl-accepting chemotaxis protein [Defluviitaleaceae bacterium]|nr:methyl-accepting chemotaxis protein [Defluviitaleaceae bacterium]
MKNLKIGARLYIVLAISIVATIVVSVFAVVNLNRLTEYIRRVDTYNVAPLSNLVRMTHYFDSLRRQLRDAVITEDPVMTGYHISEVVRRYESLVARADAYREHLISMGTTRGEEFDTITKFIDALPGAAEIVLRIAGYAERNDRETALHYLETQCVPFTQDMNDWLEQLAMLNDRQSEMLANEARSSEISAYISMGIAAGISIIALLVFILATTSSIITPLRRMVEASENIAAGNLNINLDTTAKDETGDLARKLEIVISAVRGMVDDISKFNYETNVNGDIEYRINASKYQGAYSELILSLNDFTDSFVKDMLVLIGSLGQINDGNFNMQIDDLPGKKMVLPNTLRAVSATLKELSESVVYLAKNAADGRLDVAVDESKFNGSWAEIAHTLNNLVEAVEKPLSQIENNMEHMAKGDFSRLEGDFKGIFKKVKQACNFNNKTTLAYINEIAEVLGRVAQGDLTVSINRDYIGSYALIKTSLTTILESLNTTMANIQDVTGQVVAGAEQISQSANHLAEGASRQSAAIEELTASMETIDQKAKDSAANAADANERAANSSAFAKQGDEVVKSMLVSIDKVKESGKDISKIIKVISDIAFQTNLLSLNAAVEAARAGEHGRGFSVVAEEVRNLAGRSQQSAGDTTVIIEANGQNTDIVAGAAANVADSFGTIVENISQMSKIIAMIVEMSREQAGSISAVNDNIGEISKVVQSNSATAQESAAAAEELNSQSEVLRQLVSFFNLRNG